ncbi:MAG: copper resistance protein NlpE N-terminal domain-containing protein [Lachnospiraceae bacterium]|jgi:hypothetical protein|nr:copper resistance protein NlpE N-terminal domain-containing protein [Lachnospiraceae bacterium]MBQ8602819.1 copper resistance protein NlpE N-terminal domain-containing protein [Bacteroides sp.]
MKKLLMFAALVAALASCQSNNKKTVQAEMADTTMDALPIMEVDEVFTGTIPAADGPGIDFVLTLGVTTDGIDTLYTLDMTYLDAAGPGKNQTFTSKGKKNEIHKVVNNKPKKAVKLTPDDGNSPMYFVIVNDTTLRMVNDSTLQETISQSVYDLTKVKN